MKPGFLLALKQSFDVVVINQNVLAHKVYKWTLMERTQTGQTEFRNTN